MGAFDGIRIPYDSGYSSGGFSNQYDYFPTQSAFKFFDGFGMKELIELLTEAELSDSNTVYIPHERPGNGHIGCSTWYIRALITEYFGDTNV